MYNDIDYNKASAEELLKSINLKYYSDKIYELDCRINKILSGQPERTNGKVYEGKEKEKRIKELKKIREKTQNEENKYNEFISTIDRTLTRLDTIAEERALIYLFDYTVTDILNGIYNYQTREIVNTEINKKFGNRILRVISKDEQKISKEARKITKPAYRALKKYAKRIKIKIKTDYVRYLSEIISDRFSINTIFSRALSDMSKRYEKDSYFLGVNRNLLDDAVEIFKHNKNVYVPNECAGSLKGCIESLESFMKSSLNTKLHLQCSDLLDSYQQAMNLAREIETFSCVLEAFKNTVLKDYKGYKYVKKVCEEQERDLRAMIDKANQKYKSLNIEMLIKMDARLSELYRDYQFSKGVLARAEEKNLPFSEVLRHEEKIGKIRSEMIEILNKYPELSTDYYLKSLKLSEEKEIENNRKLEEAKESHGIKKIFGGGKKVEEVKVESAPANNSLQQSKSSDVQKIEVKDVSVGVVPKLIDEDLDRIDDQKLREEIVIPPELYDLNTRYYREYLKAKYNNPKLKQLKYSEYLQQVCPNLKDLIELERKREERLENIYKKYLKYRMGLKDKKNYLSFSDFANIRYNVETIPTEFEERFGIRR